MSYRCDGCGREIKNIYYRRDEADNIKICSKSCGIAWWGVNVKSASGASAVKKSDPVKISPNHDRLTPQEKEKIIALKKQGYTYADIGEKVNRSVNTVYRVIREWKLRKERDNA